MPICHSHLQRSFDLSNDLIEQANSIVKHCSQDSCLVLAGILRDCGLKVRGATVEAEAEIDLQEKRSNRLRKTLGTAS